MYVSLGETKAPTGMSMVPSDILFTQQNATTSSSANAAWEYPQKYIDCIWDPTALVVLASKEGWVTAWLNLTNFKLDQQPICPWV